MRIRTGPGGGVWSVPDARFLTRQDAGQTDMTPKVISPHVDMHVSPSRWGHAAVRTDMFQRGIRDLKNWALGTLVPHGSANPPQ